MPKYKTLLVPDSLADEFTAFEQKVIEQGGSSADPLGPVCHAIPETDDSPVFENQSLEYRVGLPDAEAERKQRIAELIEEQRPESGGE